LLLGPDPFAKCTRGMDEPAGQQTLQVDGVDKCLVCDVFLYCGQKLVKCWSFEWRLAGFWPAFCVNCCRSICPAGKIQIFGLETGQMRQFKCKQSNDATGEKSANSINSSSAIGRLIESRFCYSQFSVPSINYPLTPTGGCSK